MMRSLIAPVSGEYIFAMTVDDEAALYSDGKPLLFARIGPADTRCRATVTLEQGRHDFVLYHANTGGDGRVTVGWQRPDANAFDVIPREAFGMCYAGQVGAMEAQGKSLLADFTATQVRECFVADRYTFRYHFAS